MAKAQKKKTTGEPISISKIYETIKARDFLQELWWDLISDIQEKPTYKRIKEMVASLINDTIKDFSTEPCTDAERLKRRTMLTEISIMTYTVDTVISEVLFRKLQNEFQFIIANMIDDLKTEKTPSETAKAEQSNTMLENIENIFTSEAKNLKENRIKDPKTGHQTKTGLLPSQTSPEMTAATTNIPARRGRPRRLDPVTKSTPSNLLSSTPLPRKRGRPALSTTKKSTNPVANKKSPTLPKSISRDTKQTTDNISNTLSINGIKTEIDDIDQESDAESTCSEGSLSMTSVSSVHTSELSSFEDTISIDGDEENGQKKQIPLKVANDMYLQGTLSQIYQIGKRTEKQKMSLQSSDSSVPKSSKHSSSTDSSSLLRKVLPQRVRKPNSKYNSETIICEAYPPMGISPSSPKVNHNTPVQSQPRQKRRKTSSSDEKSEKSTSANSSPIRCHSNVNSLNKNSPATKSSPTVNHISPSTSSTKRYDASDLYKPRTAISSYGSRGSSAITLFSTLNQ